MYIYTYVYTYIYIYTHNIICMYVCITVSITIMYSSLVAHCGHLRLRRNAHYAQSPHWVFIKRGCSRRGVQWMGVVSYNKLVHHII